MVVDPVGSESLIAPLLLEALVVLVEPPDVSLVIPPLDDDDEPPLLLSLAVPWVDEPSLALMLAPELEPWLVDALACEVEPMVAEESLLSSLLQPPPSARATANAEGREKLCRMLPRRAGQGDPRNHECRGSPCAAA